MAFRLDTTGAATIGGAGSVGDALLFTARSDYGLLAMAELGDGTIAIADSWQDPINARLFHTSVKFFDESGRLLHVASVDSGPSAIRGVGRMCVSRADTLMASNGGTAVLDRSGGVVRLLAPDLQDLVSQPDHACFSDGSILMCSTSRLDFTDPHPTQVCVAHRSDGSLAHEFGEQPYITPPPSSRHPSVIAVQDHLYVAAGETSEIKVFDLANRLVRTIRWTDMPDSVTAAERAANVGLPRMTLDGATVTPSTVTYRPTWPAHGRVTSDGTGRVWVEDYGHSLMSNGWTAFDSTGKLLGRLVLPDSVAGERRYGIVFDRNDLLLFRVNTVDKRATVTRYPLLPVSSP